MPAFDVKNPIQRLQKIRFLTRHVQISEKANLTKEVKEK